MTTNETWLIYRAWQPGEQIRRLAAQCGLCCTGLPVRQVEHPPEQDQISRAVGTGRRGRPPGRAAETADLHEPFRRIHRPSGGLFQDPPQQVLVLCDDVTQAPGKLRIRPSGSAGGHNGLKNIIARLGGQDFPRIRIGVGAKPHPDYDLADWVLGKFPPKMPRPWPTAGRMWMLPPGSSWRAS